MTLKLPSNLEAMILTASLTKGSLGPESPHGWIISPEDTESLELGTVTAKGGRWSEAQAPEAPSPSLAIDINSSDIKALYRRCQALEHLGKLDQAFKDVQRCATLEPRNQNFQETLRRLNTSIQEKVSWTAPRKPWPASPHS